MEAAVQEKQDVEKLKLLVEAFERFTGAGETMSRAYAELKDKADELNIQLEQTNKELARNLAEKERLSIYLSNVLHSLGSGVLVLDSDGRVEMANRAVTEMIHAKNGSITGKGLRQVFSGTLRPAAVFDDFFIDEKDVPEREFEWSPSEGDTRVLRASCHPMIGSDAGSVGRILLVEDITAESQGRAEAERTKRLAAMGEMAVKIVHEVRNPMGSIELIASLLARDLADDADKLGLVERIRSGIRSMNHIISNLLAFARNTQPVFRLARPSELLDDCLDYYTHLLSSQQIRLEKEFPEDALEFYGDPDLLKQVFMNLILNATQAMPKGGCLTLSARKRLMRDFETGKVRPFIQVSVKDTGVGMSDEVRAKVFHPFFTTKERGTGLGLALSHKIVKAHNGVIEVDSAPEKGTVFAVNIPMEKCGSTVEAS